MIWTIVCLLIQLAKSTDEIIVDSRCRVNEDPFLPTHLSFPGDCTKFYKCLAGKAYPVSCPIGLHWSIALNRCDWPNVAKCDGNSSPSQTATHQSPSYAYQTTLQLASKPNVALNSEQILSNGECPLGEDPKNPTHLPYPGDCSKFYKCLAGEAHPINCPDGLHWSVTLKRCDWPSVANCHGTAQDTQQETSWFSQTLPQPAKYQVHQFTSIAKGSKNCPLGEDPMNPTHLPYPGDCTKFYKCLAGEAHPVNCPDGLHWSVTLKRCDWPSVANCHGTAPDTQQKITLETSKLSQTLPQPANYQVHQFTSIAKGSENCPLGEDPMHPTHLPYPGDCTKFYKCLAGEAHPVNCPDGLHWSVTLKRCDWPSVANCHGTAPDTQQKITLETSKLSQTLPQPANYQVHQFTSIAKGSENCPLGEDPMHPTHLPYPGDCTKFYKCLAGEAHPVNCPDGLHWSVTLKRCDWPSVANCHGTAPDTQQKITLETSKLSQTLPQPANYQVHQFTSIAKGSENCPLGEDPMHPTHLPYPGDCTKFYKCLAGEAHPVNCPDGLHWSVTLKRCDWPSVANCHGTAPDTQQKIKIETSKLSQTLPQPANYQVQQFTSIAKGSENCPLGEDPMNPTHLPYPGDCTKFYKCLAGEAHPVNCPDGLHWSVTLKRCDWPSVANCHGTVPDAQQEASLLSQTLQHPANYQVQQFTSIAKGSENCPLGEDPMNPTHLPYPGDCTKFYKCLAGEAHPVNCPDGLHWSVTLKRCDWPSVANCHGTVPDAQQEASLLSQTLQHPANYQVQQFTSIAKGSENCPLGEDPMNPTHLPYPGDCTKFYKCLAGEAHPVNCPDGLHWSVTLKRCDWPSVANCHGTVPDTQQEASWLSQTLQHPANYQVHQFTSIAKGSENCPLGEDPMNPTHLPYPGDCTKFYKCLAGEAHPVNCPDGLHWSVTLKRCDWPSVANCHGIAPDTQQETSLLSQTLQHPANYQVHQFTSTAKGSINCPLGEDPMHPTHLSYPGDCTKFYKCLAGEAHPVNCPDGLHWSTTLNRCDWPSVAKCHGTFPIPQPSLQSIPQSLHQTLVTVPKLLSVSLPALSTLNEKCPLGEDPKKPTHFPYPEDCTKFYKCLDGMAHQMTCPYGLYWDTVFNRCDWPETAKCDGIGPVSQNIPAHQPLLSTAIQLSAQQAPQPAPQPVSQPAPQPAPQPASQSNKLPSKPNDVDAYCIETSGHSGYAPYPGDCTRFVQCFHGRAYVHYCPSGLQFDSKLNICSINCN